MQFALTVGGHAYGIENNWARYHIALTSKELLQSYSEDLANRLHIIDADIFSYMYPHSNIVLLNGLTHTAANLRKAAEQIMLSGSSKRLFVASVGRKLAFPVETILRNETVFISTSWVSHVQCYLYWISTKKWDVSKPFPHVEIDEVQAKSMYRAVELISEHFPDALEDFQKFIRNDDDNALDAFLKKIIDDDNQVDPWFFEEFDHLAKHFPDWILK